MIGRNYFSMRKGEVWEKYFSMRKGEVWEK